MSWRAWRATAVTKCGVGVKKGEAVLMVAGRRNDVGCLAVIVGRRDKPSSGAKWGGNQSEPVLQLARLRLDRLKRARTEMARCQVVESSVGLFLGCFCFSKHSSETNGWLTSHLCLNTTNIGSARPKPGWWPNHLDSLAFERQRGHFLPALVTDYGL